MGVAGIERFSLVGKVAVVTGVSRGLGQSIAVGLAEAGADIIGIGINFPQKTQQLVQEMGCNFTFLKADLSKQEEAERVGQDCLKNASKVDILVNNSGIIRREPAENVPIEGWDEVLAVNLKSAYILSQIFGRKMLECHRGKIINIASMLSFQGGKNVVAYTASKHAIAGVTRALANEWGARGVCVNAIAPGYMKTDNTAPLLEDEQRTLEIQSRIPVGRWGNPEDVIGAVIFLASEASNYVNGHILCVDGGWMSS